MSEELKPCPFCGREPKIKAVMKSYGLTIWCACKCGAQTGGFCPNTSNEDNTIKKISREVRKKLLKHGIGGRAIR